MYNNMDAEKLFDAFPNIFFTSLKEQMFMGILPSETVETLLKPVLEEYNTLMPQLPVRIQHDIQDIFKIYPELAEEYLIQTQESPLASAIRDTAKKLRDFIFSPIWEPRWAGQPVTAASVPKQENTFSMGEFGKISIACYWKSPQNSNPAYIWVSWKAYITLPGELYIRFANPETQEKRYEVSLGKKLTGERVFTESELGFDPLAEKWAISLILAEVK